MLRPYYVLWRGSKKRFEPIFPEGLGGRRRDGSGGGRCGDWYRGRGGDKDRLIVSRPVPLQAGVSFYPIIRRDVRFELIELGVGLFLIAQLLICRGIGLCKLYRVDHAAPKIPRQEDGDGDDDNREELREPEVAFFGR